MEQAPFPLPEADGQELDRIGLEFLADFLGEETRRRPENVEALTDLGHVLTRLKRHAEGLAVDQRLARLAPDDANVRYNLACSLALVGDTDGAIDQLRTAITLGYRDAEHLLQDEDLLSVREDPRFQEIVRRLRESAADVEPG